MIYICVAIAAGETTFRTALGSIRHSLVTLHAQSSSSTSSLAFDTTGSIHVAMFEYRGILSCRLVQHIPECHNGNSFTNGTCLRISGTTTLNTTSFLRRDGTPLTRQQVPIPVLYLANLYSLHAPYY